ncbi:MAG TPA: hypothetical protein PK634_00425, partial [Kiritimatiellia bacterium]|nr:hypothetical protein [Kiritimatiellia bacterium]
MKKHLAIIVALVGLIAPSLAATETISVSMDMPAVSIGNETGGFVDVLAEGRNSDGRPARPMLPGKSVFYALPPDVDAASVSIVVTKTEYRD